MAAFFDDPACLAPPRALRQDLSDGSFVLRSPEALLPYARCIGDWLERWAQETPDALAFAERSTNASAEGAWRRLSWSQTRAQVGSIAQALLSLNLPAGKPVVVLSDNALDHLLLMLAAMHIGRPVCTVSSAYCRLTKDFSKIAGILEMLDPALIYASDAAVYGPAVKACERDAVTVFSQGAASVPGAFPFELLTGVSEGPAVMRAFHALLPEDHAKYLLTSGSTGHPKVAINTHRMLCANQQMMVQTWRWLQSTKPVLLDWLPWSHTFGGNHNLNMVLANGGTLYIDDGRPMPGLIEKTVRNLQEVKPNFMFNVPRGFDMLLPFLEADLHLAREVLVPLVGLFYAGAALPSASWHRLQAVAAQVREEPLWLTTSWGSTETAPAVTSAHWKLEGAGNIGLPLPGVDLKFIPNGEKLELRVRGVSVFPGYRHAPKLSAEAFDAEGFYKIGDAGLLADPQRPEKGVMFNGRVAEDFKLTSGTWVSVGTLRLKLVSALSPLASDAVVTGHDRDQIGALVFLTPAAQQQPRERVLAQVQDALHRLKLEGGGSSQAVARVLLMTEPASVDAGEITDKGYINQRAVLARRAELVTILYTDPSDERVVVAR